ncbi:MAG: TIGR01777 family oxidoreductase [Litorimonas sp.]
MTILLWTLICAQIVMGGLDTLGHHEVTERLAWRDSQRRELRLHALRNLFYGFVLAGLATVQPTGWPALALIAVLAAEFLITLRDFAEEDATRKLPVTERLLHTVLTANYGAILALLIPVLLTWSREPAGLDPVWHGWMSVICLLGALACTGLAIRDWLASNRFARLRTRPLARIAAPTAAPQTVLVTGGTGFIGQRLIPALQETGHRVVLLARDGNVRGLRPPFTVVERLDDIPNDRRIDTVVNLAGAPILAGPWTRAARHRIRDSRIATTQDVVRLIDRLHTRPATLIQGSAIGVYGVEAGRVNERTPIRRDGSFSQALCLDWEAEAAKAAGIRTVFLRIGIVLDRAGGALGQMLVPTEYAGGMRLGRGDQRMSWIGRDDLVRLVLHLIERPEVQGPVNAVSGIATNRDFTRSLARALHRPSWLAAPTWLLRRVGMGREILLADQAVTARDIGFMPLDRDLDTFLAANLGRRSAPRNAASRASLALDSAP